MAQKSSFVRRQLSKEDAIIQLFRPMIQGRITQALDVLERLVTEAETLTKLGTAIQSGERGGERLHLTPKDLKANLDEFGELEQIAKMGRDMLRKLGFVSLRQHTPIIEGTAPVGKSIDVTPITVATPGTEPVSGVVIKPKKKAE